MTEPIPVIQLGTYTFDSFNVLDPNMYSSSAENISAFSNGMAAVADLNSKTNHLLQRIKNAKAGAQIAINIDLRQLQYLVNPSIQFKGDLVTSASLVISAGSSITDFKHMLVYNSINLSGEMATELAVGFATFKTQQVPAGLFVNSLSVSLDYIVQGDSNNVKKVELSLVGFLSPTSNGLQGFITARFVNLPDFTQFFNYKLNQNNFGVQVDITELLSN